MKRLPSSFYHRDSLQVAPDLLGKLLVSGSCVARITEVEAYRGYEDPASHAYRGRTKRNEVMFGPGGFLYVYFIYGMHFCANVVTGDTDMAQAVLLRGAIPVNGAAVMKRRRHITSEKNLCNGPARLAQAFGLNRSHNGAKLFGQSSIYIADDYIDVSKIETSSRIGISSGTELKWRFTFQPQD